MAQYALPEYDAALLTQSHALAAYFEATAAAAGNAKPPATGSWAT
jgi:aspartyl-tRNA(Asn)/glutamyl-tRNA(Gln) amidotransferase subunit B